MTINNYFVIMISNILFIRSEVLILSEFNQNNDRNVNQNNFFNPSGVNPYYPNNPYSYPPQQRPVLKKTAYVCSLLSFVLGISSTLTVVFFTMCLCIDALSSSDSPVLSVIGFIFTFVFAPIPSLVFGIIGLVQSKHVFIQHAADKARVFSIIGIILSVLCCISFVVFCVVAMYGLNSVYS